MALVMLSCHHYWSGDRLLALLLILLDTAGYWKRDFGRKGRCGLALVTPKPAHQAGKQSVRPAAAPPAALAAAAATVACCYCCLLLLLLLLLLPAAAAAAARLRPLLHPHSHRQECGDPVRPLTVGIGLHIGRRHRGCPRTRNFDASRASSHCRAIAIAHLPLGHKARVDSRRAAASAPEPV